MTTSYRSNAREGVLRARYESAKRTLEELAKQDHTFQFTRGEECCGQYCGQLSDALVTMGFEKRSLRKSDYTNSTIDEAVVHVRKQDGKTEILADHKLGRQVLGLNLYRIPAEQNIQEWYDAIPTRIEAYTNKVERRTLVMGVFGVAGAMLGAGATIYSLGISTAEVLLAEAAILTVMMATIHAAERSLCRYPLHKELIASDAKVLQHIANTPFEDVLEYHNVPVPVRVDVSKEYAEQARQGQEEAVVEAGTKRQIIR